MLPRSHPTWVRGLKRTGSEGWVSDRVAPYVGAWIETSASSVPLNSFSVAPYVGAWIETIAVFASLISFVSHPTWVRGLKHAYVQLRLRHAVAPYVGAWIETSLVTPRLALLGRTLRGCVD